MDFKGSLVSLLAVVASTPIQCFDWDSRFLNAFHALLGVVIVVSISLLILFLLRPLGWTTAHPYLRVVVSTLPFCLMPLAVAAKFLLSPLPGLFSIFQILPEYLDCAGVDFEAAGFLGGLSGAGASAISQPIVMALISLVGWGSYILLLWAVTGILGRIGWPRGLKGHLPA